MLAIQCNGSTNRLTRIVCVIRIVQNDFQFFIFLTDRCGQWKWLQWCCRRWRCNRCSCRNWWLWLIGAWFTICLKRWQIFIRILAHCRLLIGFVCLDAIKIYYFLIVVQPRIDKCTGVICVTSNEYACLCVCVWVFYLFMKIGAVDKIVSFRGDRPITICTKQKPQISQLMNNFHVFFVCVCFSLSLSLSVCACLLYVLSTTTAKSMKTGRGEVIALCSVFWLLCRFASFHYSFGSISLKFFVQTRSWLL